MAEYTVLQQLPVNRRNPDTGQLEAGIEITFKDLRSGATGIVFLPDDRKTVEGARLLIERELAILRGIDELGK